MSFSAFETMIRNRGRMFESRSLRIGAAGINSEKSADPPAPLRKQTPKAPVAALPTLHKDYAKEYVQSFKGKPPDMHMFDLRGKFEGAQYLQYERNGLRVTWPTGYKGGSLGTGLSYRAAVSGDYELTLRFEILKNEQAPKSSIGTRVSLGGYLDMEPEKSGGAVTQILLSNGKVQYATNLSIPNESKVNGQRLADFLPAAGKIGRLRLVRSEAFFIASGLKETIANSLY